MRKTNLQQQILIDSLPEKIWTVLTHPDYLVQYLPEGAINSEWKDELSMAGSKASRPAEPKTVTRQAITGTMLHYTVREERTGDLLLVTYQLRPSGEGTILTVEYSQFSDTEEEFLFRNQQARLLLQKIKWLAEYA